MGTSSLTCVAPATVLALPRLAASSLISLGISSNPGSLNPAFSSNAACALKYSIAPALGLFSSHLLCHVLNMSFCSSVRDASAPSDFPRIPRYWPPPPPPPSPLRNQLPMVSRTELLPPFSLISFIFFSAHFPCFSQSIPFLNTRKNEWWNSSF